MFYLFVPIVHGYCIGTKYQCGTAETTFSQANKIFSYTVWFYNSNDKSRILKTIRFKISPYDSMSFDKGVKKKIISTDTKWTVTKIALRTDDPQYSQTQFKENVDYLVVNEKEVCNIQSTTLLPCQSVQIQILSSRLQKLNKSLDITFGPFTVVSAGSSNIELETYESTDINPSAEQLTTLSSGYSSIPEKKPWYILLDDFLFSGIKKYFKL
jgi:hypothetical protein